MVIKDKMWRRIRLYMIASEVAKYAPNGGGEWQGTGMKAVPVSLLTQLKEAVDDYTSNAASSASPSPSLPSPRSWRWRWFSALRSR